jgi:predicted Zn-dependent protease
VLLVAAAYFGWYWMTHQQEAAFTGRTQLIDTSIEEEVALGLQAWQQTLAESDVVSAGPLPGQVRDIARRLVEAGPGVERYLAEHKGTPAATPWDQFAWEVSVIDSPQVNAFCLPGGKIAVYTGLFPIAQTRDALAVVMGHEIAHALLRHSSQRMAQQKLVQMGQVAAGMSGMDQQTMAALGAGVQYGVVLPYGRNHESQADEVGLMLAAAACYDPQQAIPLWERMSQLGGGQRPPEFASTHPDPSNRIARLQQLMPEAEQFRARYCGGQPASDQPL